MSLLAAQEALVDLMLVGPERAAWEADPITWSTNRLGSGPSASMVAGLRPPAVDKAALHMASKNDADRKRSERLAKARASRPTNASAAGSTASPGTEASSHLRVPAPRPPRLPAVGCGFRRPLVGSLLGEFALVEVWEHIAEWYLDARSLGERQLARFAATDPVALHCVGLSLGSGDCLLDIDRIEGVGRLARAAGVDHVTDHLAFCRVGGRTLPHFFPLWRTAEQLELIAGNVNAIQDRLGVRLIIENPATMVDPGGEFTTAAFLNELCRRTGCGMLLDLENLRVNDANGYLDATAELATFDLGNVIEVHVAGGAPKQPGDALAIDTHDHPVDAVVFNWLADLLPDLANCEHVIIERDDRFDHGSEVLDDLRRLHELIGPARRPVDKSPVER